MSRDKVTSYLAVYQPHLFAKHVTTTLTCGMRHQVHGAKVALWGEHIPVKGGGVGHPDRATPQGSQCRQQSHVCSLRVQETPSIAVQHQIVSSLQGFCSGKPSQELSDCPHHLHLVPILPGERADRLCTDTGAQSLGCRAVPPHAPQCPTAGRAAGPVLWQRDASAKLQPTTLLCAPAHPTGL